VPIPENFIDLSPENTDPGYRQHGEAVMREALTRLEREAPDIAQQLLDDRAFATNVYGRDDLLRLDQWLAKYSAGGCRIISFSGWHHAGAGRVVTAVFAVPMGRTAKEVIAEKLGWGRA